MTHRRSGYPHRLAAGDDVQEREECSASGLIQRRMIAVGPRVNGFERCPAYLVKESTREEVALACHAAGLFWFQLIELETTLDLLLHAFHILWAWGQCDVVIVCGDDDPLDLVL